MDILTTLLAVTVLLLGLALGLGIAWVLDLSGYIGKEGKK